MQHWRSKRFLAVVFPSVPSKARLPKLWSRRQLTTKMAEEMQFPSHSHLIHLPCCMGGLSITKFHQVSEVLRLLSPPKTNVDIICMGNDSVILATIILKKRNVKWGLNCSNFPFPIFCALQQEGLVWIQFRKQRFYRPLDLEQSSFFATTLSQSMILSCRTRYPSTSESIRMFKCPWPPLQITYQHFLLALNPRSRAMHNRRNLLVDFLGKSHQWFRLYLTITSRAKRWLWPLKFWSRGVNRKGTKKSIFVVSFEISLILSYEATYVIRVKSQQFIERIGF